MYYVYFDESKYPQKDFIIGSFVFCKEAPDETIGAILSQNEFDTSTNEFKSSTHFGRNPKMKIVRESLKDYFHENCSFGLVVMPHSEIKNLGFIALDALSQFITANRFTDSNSIYFDEGIFSNVEKAIKYSEKLGLSKNSLHFEQNSKVVKGIQLADLCSHSLTTILRETLGDLTKTVEAGENSGYDPKDQLEIGFEIWASIRHSFLREASKKYSQEASQEENLTYDVEPYGLYIARSCDVSFTEKIRATFGTVFLGCIH